MLLCPLQTPYTMTRDKIQAWDYPPVTDQYRTEIVTGPSTLLWLIINDDR
jgi:hypothetical protein